MFVFCFVCFYGCFLSGKQMPQCLCIVKQILVPVAVLHHACNLEIAMFADSGLHKLTPVNAYDVILHGEPTLAE